MSDLNADQLEELHALAANNDAIDGPSFLFKAHWPGYQALVDDGLVEWTDPPGGMDPKLFRGTRITTAGRAVVQRKCKRCGTQTKPGVAILQTFKPGTKDFASDSHATTFSAGGPGELAACLKCPECGHSYSPAVPEAQSDV